MIDIDSREIHELRRKLEKVTSRSMPYAQRSTLNGAAFHARRQAQTNIENKMTLRNSWTRRQVAVSRASVSQPYSVVGATVEYLAAQEFGGTTKGPVPTSYSAGQGRAPKRTRLVRKPNKMRNISLRQRSRTGSRKAQNAAAVKSGERHVYLDLGRRRGIFRVLGGKRRPRIEMVWSLDRGIRQIPRNPWLAPAVEDARKAMPALFAKAMRFQLERLR